MGRENSISFRDISIIFSMGLIVSCIIYYFIFWDDMLSDSEILEELGKGNIIIKPFRKEQLNPNSYDVRLGEYYAVENVLNHVILPFDENSVRNHWKIKKANKEIEIHPGETILAHTQEIIGGRHNIASKMNARSSLGRLGLSVCKCAGFGDVGFICLLYTSPSPRD